MVLQLEDDKNQLFKESVSREGIISFSGCDFVVADPTLAYSYDTAGQLVSGANGNEAYYCIKLPHEAVIDSVIVYGFGGNSWALWRVYASGSAKIAEATFNSADTTIKPSTVDNSTYWYMFRVYDFDSGNSIKSGRVRYST